MNKAERARQLAKQTAEQEQGLENQKIAELQEIKQSILAMMDVSLTMVKNQSREINYQQDHLPTILEIKEQITAMEKNMKGWRWIWIATLIGAYLLGWLVCWMII